jgi:hypothetical protein
MTTIAGQIVTGTFGSAVIGTSFQPIANKPFDIWLSGTFVATVAVLRSIDGGVVWVPVLKPDLSAAQTFTIPASLTAFEADAAALWTVSTAVANGGAWTSGTVTYRLGS